MVLAHSVTPGGPETEYLAIAGAMLILGVVFFVQKTAKPMVSIGLIVGALVVATGAFAFRSSSTASASGIEMSLMSPRSGEDVDAGRPVELRVELQGAAIAGSESGDETPGHLHVFVDNKTVAMPTTLAPKVKLKPGEHTVAVEFVDSRHQSFDPQIIAEVRLDAR